MLGGRGLHCPLILPPSSLFGEKGGRMHDLPRLPRWPPASGPIGGCLCHPGSGALNQQGRDQGPVLPSVQAMKITRVPTMWAGMDGGIGWGCDVLLEKLGRKGANHQEDQKNLNWQLPIHHDKTPRRRRRGTSTERDLTQAREAN